MTSEGTTWVQQWLARYYRDLTIWYDPQRIRLVTADDGMGVSVNYYELPDGRRLPIPTDPRLWSFSDYPEDQPRRAEQMITRREPDGSTTELADWSLAGIGTQETAGDFALQLLSRALGPEAVAGLEGEDISVRLETQDGQVVRIYETPDGESVTRPVGDMFDAAPEEGAMEELERFVWTIKNLDPAESAWNPVTGLEPVLCRVCGNSSDPRSGKALTHPDRYPCTPRVEPAEGDGHTTQVRDTVLLRSANMREVEVTHRTELQPWEVLSISVRAYANAGFRQDSVPFGDVRECPLCLAVSHTPTWPVQHDDARCSAKEGYVVAGLDPRELDVAACHVPGARSITDPEWYHLNAGWWVAMPGTPGPEWADTYVEEEPLPKVSGWAYKPSDLTPVRLTAADREQSQGVAQTLARMARYFRLLDRPETVHGITALTQAIATAVEQSWNALEALHNEDDGTVLHAAVGLSEACPVCEHRARPAGAPEWLMDNLASTLHARMVTEPGRRLNLRQVRIILDHLAHLRRRGQFTEDAYRMATTVVHQVNHHFLVSPDPRDRGQGRVFIADVGVVAREYARYIREGGPL